MNLFNAFEQQPYEAINETDIAHKLHEQLKTINLETETELYADMLAFQFLDNYSSQTSTWGGHYQPSRYLQTDTGHQPYPNPELITIKVIEFWHKKMDRLTHPVLKTRFSGLLYEFTQTTTGKKVSHLIAENYITALIETVEKKLYLIEKFAIKKLGKALEVASAYSNTSLISRIKTQVIGLEQHIPITEEQNKWGFTFDLLLNGKKNWLNSDEEDQVIKTLESRLQYLKHIDPWASAAAASRLAQYYLKKEKPEEVKRVILDLGYAYQYKASTEIPIQAIGQLDELLHIYRKYHLHDEATKVLIQLRELGKKSNEEMKSIVSEQTIDTTELKALLKKILVGDAETVLSLIVELLIPKLDNTKKELRNTASKHPIQYLVTNTIVDEKGRQVAQVGSIEKDFEGHLAKHTGMQLHMHSLLTHILFDMATTTGYLTVDNTLAFLKKSCIIEEDRFAIICRGIEAFFEKDYQIFAHLVVPQFEEAIRNLLEMNGGNILVDKNKAYQLKTFHQLLEDKIIEQVFGESSIYYFKILFTDPRGWNLRNRISHGMINPNLLDTHVAQRLFHAILTLGMIRLIEYKQP
ncbi:DUF4209 domain-containing protein [Pedobacter sp. FW305-3-2-15-E-R2A2]|uniref:DUF4209 domain-containing protein n=1 Tax=Pedobacter sp. FW305-3-2-15-E-R2A2 TaxID=3140251 RepID=UPI003140B323